MNVSSNRTRLHVQLLQSNSLALHFVSKESLHSQRHDISSRLFVHRDSRERFGKTLERLRVNTYFELQLWNHMLT